MYSACNGNKVKLVALSTIIFILNSCGGNENSNPVPVPVVVLPPSPPSPPPPPPSPPPATTSTLSITHVFGLFAEDSGQPNGPLMEASDRNFYGTTRGGGKLSCPANVSSPCGTIFKMTSAGDVTVFYRFGAFASDGNRPTGALIEGSDGRLYGMTTSGGSVGGGGTIYRLTFGGGYSQLYSFGVGTDDGYTPAGALVQGRDGNFYGATSNGGKNDCPSFQGKCGTLFKMTPAGAVTFLYSFTNQPTDGIQPTGSLTEGSDGNFYGTTTGGGAYGFGTIFRMTSSGVVTTLHSFGATQSDGKAPQGGVILASDGNFYGTTVTGGLGPYASGTIYRMTASGVVTTIYQFGMNGGLVDGDGPNQYLIEGNDGLLYGMTNSGGEHLSASNGTFFRISKSGQKSTLYSFGPVNQKPYDPDGGVIQASNGDFYGILENNGNFGGVGPYGGAGAIFRYGPTR